MATRTRKTSWATRAKQLCQQSPPRKLDDAVRAYSDLKLADQLQLVSEIAETRGAELCRAYRGVVAVYHGYRRRKDKRGNSTIVREPCVTFVVRKKWSKKADERPDQKLPAYILGYWSIRGRRVRCAVPTDVDDASTYSAIRPQADAQQITVFAPSENGPGVITCAIRRSTFPDRVFAMSCRHVFALSKVLAPPTKWGLRVELPGSRKIAETRRVAGFLGDAPELSLDSQLAEVTNVSDLAPALAGLRFDGIVRSSGEVPPSFFVATPHGQIPGSVAKLVHPPMDYGQRDNHNVVHRELLQSHLQSPTQEGDSGSPLIAAKTGGLLIGMHIGADDEGRSYAIPAWHLLRPDLYAGAAANEIWTLLDPASLPARAAIALPIPDDALSALCVNHNFNGGVQWRLAQDGVHVDDELPETTVGPPLTVERVWTTFGEAIEKWADNFAVPVELILATICTESRGQKEAVREEPGYTSDVETPAKVSVGLMQTLIETAQRTLDDSNIDRAWLMDPENSIRAGTAYISKQHGTTNLDPPKVACAYNAGRLAANDSAQNRWRMKQFPIGTSKHADRFVEFFNDSFRFFISKGSFPAMSFGSMLQKTSVA